MSGISRMIQWMLRVGILIASLGLHFVIVAAYARRWDRAAAITVFPFWAWGGLGLILALVGWIFGRSRWAFVMMIVWIVTILVGSDETRPLLRSADTKPLIGLPPDEQGGRPLRVVTLNCRRMNRVSAEEILPWQPDIVLLQEAPPPAAVLALANRLYPDGKPQEHALGGYSCAVLTRGKIKGFITAIGQNSAPSLLRVLPCTIEMDGALMHVVCVHLQGAVTDVGLHRRSTWALHYRNRQSRRAEMVDVRHYLETLRVLQSAPIVIGGDFNAPAGDAVFRELQPDFTDAFATVGAGWGNTFPNHTPVLRIDHLYANALLKPLRARTVKTVNSDHRMVVADFLLQKP
jgi:endonuclease/exonuclease/phosphatase (EEP) superfamily protein YafD